LRTSAPLNHQNQQERILKSHTFLACTLALTLGAGLVLVSDVSAQPNRGGQTAPETPATGFHGTPGNTPGFGGSSANPQGQGVNGGGGIHGIGNNPGQSGTNPNADGVAGFANQLNDVHGGIGDANKNVGKTN
jgi:hypothetical protein